MNPRLQAWQKFPNLDPEVSSTLRAMLFIDDDEELPENLWIIMGIHRAIECRFGSSPWSWRDLANMIVEMAFLNVSQVASSTKYIPGSEVTVKTMNINATYWSPVGSLGLHLLNSHGNLYLVPSSAIKAHDVAVAGSQLNLNARAGERIANIESLLPDSSKLVPVPLGDKKPELATAS